MNIRIECGAVTVEAALGDGPTARAVFEALPIKARVNTWGDEIYFRIPVDMGLEDGAAELVEMGDLGYWPTGKAFCIFFGSTPVSGPDEIRPASAVNVIGRVLDDPAVFRDIPDGAEIVLDRM